MRITAVLAAGLLAIAGTAAAAPAPLSSVVTRTDDGYVMGSPRAPVKLTVLSAYGCPHCRVLDDAMMQPLKRGWIDTGKVQLRYVPYGMFPTDVPSLFLSECGPVGGFFDRSGRIFRMQSEVTGTFAGVSEATRAQIAGGPPTQVPARLASAAGLVRSAPRAGVAPEAYARCLSDQNIRRTISQRQKLIEARYRFPGTPAVWINGKPTGTGSSWPKLEAMLRTAAR